MKLREGTSDCRKLIHIYNTNNKENALHRVKIAISVTISTFFRCEESQTAEDLKEHCYGY